MFGSLKRFVWRKAQWSKHLLRGRLWRSTPSSVAHPLPCWWSDAAEPHGTWSGRLGPALCTHVTVSGDLPGWGWPCSGSGLRRRRLIRCGRSCLCQSWATASWSTASSCHTSAYQVPVWFTLAVLEWFPFFLLRIKYFFVMKVIGWQERLRICYLII